MAEGSGEITREARTTPAGAPTAPPLQDPLPPTPSLRAVVDDLVTRSDLIGYQLADILGSVRRALDVDVVSLRPSHDAAGPLDGRVDVGEPPREPTLVLEAPVTVDGRLVAVLSVGREGGDPQRLEAATLAVATALGAAWATQDHRRALEGLRTTDALTELPNRRTFIERLQAEFPLATAHRALVLAMLDVNEMMAYNDTHGHSAGDRLLVAVGELLREVSGELPGTLVARLGGDEFGLITSEHSVAEMVAGLSRVQARAGSDLGISLGCGVAEHRGDRSLGLPNDLLRLADVAQHRAKSTRSATPVVAGSDERQLARNVAERAEAEATLAPVTPLRPKRRWLRDGRHDGS